MLKRPRKRVNANAGLIGTALGPRHISAYQICNVPAAFGRRSLKKQKPNYIQSMDHFFESLVFSLLELEGLVCSNVSDFHARCHPKIYGTHQYNPSVDSCMNTKTMPDRHHLEDLNNLPL
jgi:hypothetical protein